MQDFNVTVTFSFNNNQAKFNFAPDPLMVPHATTDTITWNLVGPAGAKFLMPGGVAFKNPERDLTKYGQWDPDNQPVAVSPTQYQVTDQSNASDTTGYRYSVHVVYNDQQYDHDPEVVDEGVIP